VLRYAVSEREMIGDKPTDAPPSEVFGPKELLSMARDASFVASIFLFFIGFVYREEYFNAFGIPSGAMVTNITDYFIYSYAVLRTNWINAISLLICVSILWLVIRLTLQKHSASLESARLWYAGFALVIFLSSFPIMFSLAASSAVGEVNAIRKGEEVAGTIVKLTPSFTKLYPEFSAANQSESLSVVGENATSYFILLQQSADARGQVPDGFVYELPRTSVVELRTRVSSFTK
jgi:hypothetical protein